MCLHGLGGTKASFLPTVAALADRYRVVAIDLPGFGESDKPIGAPYDADWFARSAFGAMDALGIGEAHVVGNSMGGRVAIEAGLVVTRPGARPGAAVAGAGLAARPPLGAGRAPAAARAGAAPGDAAARRGAGGAPPRAGRRRAAGPPRASTSSCAPTSPRAAEPPSTRRRATSTWTSRTATRASGRAWAALAPGLAVRLGAARHARADRLHEARRASAADGAPRRARLRPRAAAGATARDARGDGGLPADEVAALGGVAERQRRGSESLRRARPPGLGRGLVEFLVDMR